MAKKTGLGSVLDSIFDEGIDLTTPGIGEVRTLPITDIEPDKNQPRKTFDPDKLGELALSISEHGVIQPIAVRPTDDGRYLIVAGERRWRASKLAGLREVPVRVLELDDAEALQVGLIENLQREDLNPVEEAKGYRELMEKYNMKQDEVAKRVGKARSSITNSVRLLSLPEPLLTMLADETLSVGHCKVLLGLKDEELMLELAERTVKQQLPVRKLENLVKAALSPKKEEKEPVSKEEKRFLTEASLSFGESIQKPVRIKRHKNKMTIEIDVFSEEELTRFINDFTK
jgi:ParB family chromosome partitioning protein